ncbi:MAG: PAS domain S-box protein [Desulfobacterales bacterium]|nr:PAS domain S-box protein [Desulfobacterales bacterium]
MTMFQSASGISAMRWAEFLNNLPAAIYRVTIEGALVYGNLAFARLFGFESLNEMIDFPVVKLHRNKKDRGALINAVLKHGRVKDHPIHYIRRDGKPIWCAVTAKAVLDDDGMVVLMDGVMREITDEIAEEEHPIPRLDKSADYLDNAVVYLDLRGRLIDLNKVAEELFKTPRRKVRGRSLSDFIKTGYKELFFVFLSDILKTGRQEGIFTMLDRDGGEHHIRFNAILVKKNGKAHYLKGVALDITGEMEERDKTLENEKFQGVLEMAGGVAHRMNQPLMIINNILKELLTDCVPGDPHFRGLRNVRDQLERLNEITRKIGNIKKYEAMDYVAGVKIVDIDKAS